MISKEQVLDALRVVIDPDLNRDIVSLGFVKDLEIEGGSVRFSIELTTPACPVKDRFKALSEEAVMRIPGVTRVDVHMTAKSRPPSKAPAETDALKEVGSIVAVSSCKGGVGKSTVAVHLARALQREGRAVGLLDADLYGPSFPTLLRLHQPEVRMRGNHIVPVETEGLKVMSFGFILGDSPAVMRGPLVSGYIQQLLLQTEWGRLDYLLIDMPPGTGDIQLTITQRAALDGAIIVTTPNALALADVAKGILMFESVEVPVLGIVENMSYFVCDSCGKKHRIFGSGTDRLTERFGLPILAEIPLAPGVSGAEAAHPEALEAPMAALVENLHRAVGQRRLETARPIVTAEAGRVRIQWPDGSSAAIPCYVLRAACVCARCIDEYTGEDLRDPAAIPVDVDVQGIQPLGNYAVAIAWSDGHGSSIYTWPRLRELTAQHGEEAGG